MAFNQDREPIAFLATGAPDKAIGFYRDVLGLDMIDDNPFALVFSDRGIMLRIQKVGELTPVSYTAYGWRVPDIEETIAVLVAKGVSFEIFSGLGQSPGGVWTSPDGHKVAWFKDPEGNNLSLTQFPPGK